MQEHLKKVRTEGQTGQGRVWGSATSPITIGNILCVEGKGNLLPSWAEPQPGTLSLLSFLVSGLQLFWWYSDVVRLARGIQLWDPISVPKSDIRCWESQYSHYLRLCGLRKLKNQSHQRFHLECMGTEWLCLRSMTLHRKRWDIT